ncbi:FAS1-like dehydratase domain-containing protein [Massilia niastensis]|uniref:FAS1-like dehydratase domain-containing protein n=1 Tax=Massilia niastensis TaxID=544911 RepID=UPI000361BF36|nr:MaoC family dehydratase N-terminal domain-containing protein [Massilia niastensis]
MDLKEWIGTSETVTDTLTATPYAALAATLDRPAERPQPGTALPALWHWLYFLPLYRQSEVGADGHAKRGAFLPPVTLPRRMWAGSQFSFHAPLHIGDEVTRTSTIDNVTDKEGRTGKLVFVKVKHEIRRRGEDQVALTEFHDIVYRDAVQPGAAEPAPTAAPLDAQWERKVVPDDVLLFRYSALTFNGHRIHYDRRYVTEVEGYPGLIVHGPLVATLLLDLLREHLPDSVVASFEFRALRPVFDIHHFFVCAEQLADGSVHLWARDHQGWLTMDARATLQAAAGSAA